MQKGKIFTLQEGADYLGVSKKTLQRKIKQGKILAVKEEIIKNVEQRELDAFMKTDEYRIKI